MSVLAAATKVSEVSDPSLVCRMPQRESQVFRETGQRIYDICSHASKGYDNQRLYVDEESVGVWMRLRPQHASFQMLLSLLWKEFVPVAEITRGTCSVSVRTRRGMKKILKEQFFSLVSDPEHYTHLCSQDDEMYANLLFLSVFWDGDHCHEWQNNKMWEFGHYFYDFFTHDFYEKSSLEKGKHQPDIWVTENSLRILGEKLQKCHDLYMSPNGKCTFMSMCRRARVTPGMSEKYWGNFTHILAQIPGKMSDLRALFVTYRFE